MAALPTISDSEWEVMKALWEGGTQTAGQIVARVTANADRAWHARTIKTMLNRLVKKGAVEMTSHGSRYDYRARLTRSASVRAESRSFLARVFNGAAAPAVLHLLDQTHLPQQEIDRLKKLLESSRKAEVKS